MTSNSIFGHFFRRVKARKSLQVYVILLSMILFYLLVFKFPDKSSFYFISPRVANQKAVSYSFDQDIVNKNSTANAKPFVFISRSSDTGTPTKLGCIIPQLKQEDPDIMQYFEKFGPVSCGKSQQTGDGFDWVDLRSGFVIFHPDAVKKHGELSCKLTSMLRLSDFDTVNGSTWWDVKNGSRLEHDFYTVKCTAADGTQYLNYQAGVHFKPEVLKRRQQFRPDRNSLDLDIIIIGHDSLSNMAWKRHLPLSRDYLVNTLKAVEMKGHTVVGDGTPATMFPLLTGKREEDLPEARRGYEGAKPVDNYPWIWNRFSKAGYATLWQEDGPSYATFTYRLLGFEKPPVDHYFRPYAIYREPKLSSFEKDCIGTKPIIVSENDYATDAFRVYNGDGQRRFVFTFKSENSHQNNNHASKLDLHLKNHLKELQDSGYLDNALLIVFADHGARFSKIRAFAQGKLEERMPYMAIRLPEAFKRKHPELAKNIVHNSQRLTTPFDVHETLHEVLHYTGAGRANISKRGVSLFKKIPDHRDCKSADIDMHWCFCLDWAPIDIKSKDAAHAALGVVKLINSKTKKERGLCAEIAVKNITQAMRYKVNDQVLKFKDTDDGGRGRFGKMTDSTTQKYIVFQVTFVTTPGDGIYEATTTLDVAANRFHTNIKSISRINKYGSTPWCIMTKIPQLRPYCVCKQPPPTNTT